MIDILLKQQTIKKLPSIILHLKTLIMKINKSIYFGLFIALGLLATTSCKKDKNTDPVIKACSETYISTIINNAFSPANGYQLYETMDLITHEYTIQINEDGEICSVGYQNPNTWTGEYTMEVINETTSDSYSGTHSFSQTQLEFQSITPVTVNSGDVITVKRSILNHSNLNETIGNIFQNVDYSNIAYPITQGNIEFISSNFYGDGGPVPNYGQPYIPLGFRAN